LYNRTQKIIVGFYTFDVPVPDTEQRLVRATFPKRMEKHGFWYVLERVRRRDNVGSGIVVVTLNVWHKSFICLPSDVRDLGILIGHSTEISVDVNIRLHDAVVVDAFHPTHILFTKAVRNRIEKPNHFGGR
jgi:hypothetical protein